MRTLNGWQRLSIVLLGFWTLAVLAVAYVEFPSTQNVAEREVWANMNRSNFEPLIDLYSPDYLDADGQFDEPPFADPPAGRDATFLLVINATSPNSAWLQDQVKAVLDPLAVPKSAKDDAWDLFFFLTGKSWLQPRVDKSPDDLLRALSALKLPENVVLRLMALSALQYGPSFRGPSMEVNGHILRFAWGTPEPQRATVRNDYQKALGEALFRARMRHLVRILLIWALPPSTVFALAFSLAWVWRGFFPPTLNH